MTEREKDDAHVERLVSILADRLVLPPAEDIIDDIMNRGTVITRVSLEGDELKAERVDPRDYYLSRDEHDAAMEAVSPGY